MLFDLTNTVLGEGFLNLFVSLFLLTIVSAMLLVISRKWMPHARSFLLLGLIISSVLIIGLHAMCLGRPNHGLAVLSVTLPDTFISEPLKGSASNIPTEEVAGQEALPTEPQETGLSPGRPVLWSRAIKSAAVMVGIVWLCGAMGFMVKLAFDMGRLGRFRQSLIPVKDPKKLQLLRMIKSRLKLKEVPALYSSSLIESPLTVGFRHTVIVMPEKLLEVVDQDECLSLLSHESGHIKHRDNLVGLVQRIFIALNWFNPLAYVISARYSLCREDICDDYAIQMIDDSTRYTTCLVNLAEKSCLISSLTPAVGLVGGKRSLTKRLKRLLGKEQSMNAELTKTKKWMLTGLCAAVILCCLGVQTVFAQDYEAVGKRLRTAVAAGELTGEQARIMLGALRKTSQPKQGQEGQKVNMEAATKRVRAAIEAGDITPEEGRAKLQALRKHLTARAAEAKQRDSRAAYAAAEKKIQAAVKAGKITPQEGRAKLQAMKKRMAPAAAEAKARDPKAIYANAEKEIKAAIKAGKITEAQGKERLAGLKRHLAAAGDKPDAAGQARQRNLRVQYAAAEKKIRVAIKDGKITEAQGKKRLEALKKHLFASAKKKEAGGEHAVTGPASQRNLRAEYAAGVKRIKAAIEAGMITEAQGKERLEALKKRVTDGAKKKEARGERAVVDPARQRNLRAQYAAAEKKVKAAIESGRITETQGKERLMALKKHLFEDAEKKTRGERGARGERGERRERTRRR